jgi:hypothetical protein
MKIRQIELRAELIKNKELYYDILLGNIHNNNLEEYRGLLKEKFNLTVKLLGE